MTNFEMVERLRAKANITYEEAKEALEKSHWDLLEAMVLLEKEGKVDARAASYTTREETHKEAEHTESEFKVLVKKLAGKLVAGINYLCRNTFDIKRKGEVKLSLPAIVLLLLLLPWLWPTLIVLIAGLFFGFRYAFGGPDMAKNPINGAMDKAADMAENLKQDACGANREEKNED
ncbi:MAG: ubiquitin [Clostridia bacterium]